jgi:hypothetical protein
MIEHAGTGGTSTLREMISGTITRRAGQEIGTDSLFLFKNWV